MHHRSLNNGSNNPPHFEIHQAWWGMIGLGNGEREWTMEEKFEKIAEAGFTGILAKMPPPEELEKWRRVLDEYNFTFGVNSYPRTREDLKLLLKEAKDFGVQYINSQVKDSFVIEEEAISLLKDLVAEATNQGLPYFIETHRGTITQDLIRTLDYIDAIPNLQLTIDLSHYVLAGEIKYREHVDQIEPFFDKLIERTASIHARVSNGQQIQIDIGPNGEHPMTQHFIRWWGKGMMKWLENAKKGDVLPFICELGPSTYAITQHGYLNSGSIEISDRWEQALVFKRLAEEIWDSVISQRFKESTSKRALDF